VKTQTTGVVLVLALLATGCVTEGGLSLEPQTDEEQARANLAVGVGYLRDGRPDAAIDALQRALNIDPRMADAHSAIAIAFDQTGEAGLAEEHHRRATQIAPTDSNPQNAFAVFLCRQNRWSEARPFFDRAIANSQDNRPDRYMLNAATCSRTAGDLASAEFYYRGTLGVDVANVDALRGMIDLLITAENYLNGRAFWQRLERAAPLQAQDLLSCYVIEARLGDELAARDCADRLRSEYPGSPELRQQRQLEQNGV
jgi:type IV pilus assembly protein PilF